MQYKQLAIFLFLACISVTATAQKQKESKYTEPNFLLGLWQPLGKNYQILVSFNGQTFEGKIAWMKEPTDKNGNLKTDRLNPENMLRTRPILNTVNAIDFSYNTRDQIWENGQVYCPETGETVLGYIKVINYETVELVGITGFTLEQRVQRWSRVSP